MVKRAWTVNEDPHRRERKFSTLQRAKFRILFRSSAVYIFVRMLVWVCVYVCGCECVCVSMHVFIHTFSEEETFSFTFINVLFLVKQLSFLQIIK